MCLAMTRPSQNLEITDNSAKNDGGVVGGFSVLPRVLARELIAGGKR